MKISRCDIGQWLGMALLGGVLMLPAKLAAQDCENCQAPARAPEAAAAKPQVNRPKPIIRDINGLLQAGKFDEALRRIEKLRDVAKENPQVMGMLQRGADDRQAPPNAAPRKPARRAEAGQTPFANWRKFAGQGGFRGMPFANRRSRAGACDGCQMPFANWRQFAGQGGFRGMPFVRRQARAGACDTARSPRAMMWQQAAGQGAAKRAPMTKIQHLRLAAMNLKAAGCGSLAEQTRAEIGRLEAETTRAAADRQPTPPRQAPERPRVPQPPPAAERGATPDGPAALKTEMDQLRREMGELRSQIRRLKAETAPQHAPAPPLAPPTPPARPMHQPSPVPPAEQPR